MDAKILEQIKSKLVQRKADLEAEVATMTNIEEGVLEAKHEEFGDDPDENAQELTDRLDRAALVTELSKSLVDVNKALEKIDAGTYGKCKYCKADIDPQRLLVRPDSGACVKCKDALQGNGR